MDSVVSSSWGTYNFSLGPVSPTHHGRIRFGDLQPTASPGYSIRKVG